jgi:hypothetical protein
MRASMRETLEERRGASFAELAVVVNAVWMRT